VIYAANPATFLSSSNYVTRVFKSLVDDIEIDVRLSYISQFPTLYARCSSVQLTDFLFSLLVPFFSSTDLRIHKAILGQPSLFHVLNSAKINAILRNFLRIIESFTSWRQIANAITAFVRFPFDSLHSNWCQILAVVKSKISDFPFALIDSGVSFFVSSIVLLPDEDVIPHILEFSRARSHQLRSFFLKLSASAGLFIPAATFLDRVWPAALALAEDPVIEVRGTFLRCCCQFRQIFGKHGQRESEKNLTTLFMIMGKDSNQLLKVIWRECAEQFADPGERLVVRDDRMSLRDRDAQMWKSTSTLHRTLITPNGEIGRRGLRGPGVVKPQPRIESIWKKKWGTESTRRSLMNATRTKL
jgi:hypothetical protein